MKFTKENWENAPEGARLEWSHPAIICMDGRISIQGISFNDGKVLDAVVTSAQKVCVAEGEAR